MGRSRGGLTSKIHAVVDSNGLPVRLALSPGEPRGVRGDAGRDRPLIHWPDSARAFLSEGSRSRRCAGESHAPGADGPPLRTECSRGELVRT
jgi:hypothetical protein